MSKDEGSSSMEEILKQMQRNSSLLQKPKETKERLSNGISNVRIPTGSEIYGDSRAEFARMQTERLREEARKQREAEKREEEKLELLRGIKENTNVLKEMNYHLELNTHFQREIIDLTIEALSIMKSSNQDEAKTKLDTFKEKVDLLTSLKDMEETARWLIGLGKGAFLMYQSLNS